MNDNSGAIMRAADKQRGETQEEEERRLSVDTETHVTHNEYDRRDACVRDLPLENGLFQI